MKGGEIMNKKVFAFPILISFILGFLLFLTFSCKQIDSDKAASLIYDALKLEEDDKLEILEFRLESPKTALAIFRLNGDQLSSRIKKQDGGWLMSEIQIREDEWIPAEYFLIIKGKLVDELGNLKDNALITLFVLVTEKGEIKPTFTFRDGIFLNPNTHSDSEGRFTLTADRRLWEESGEFTLGVTDHANRTTYITNPNNIIISIKVDKNTKRVDLGEIKVRY